MPISLSFGTAKLRKKSEIYGREIPIVFDYFWLNWTEVPFWSFCTVISGMGEIFPWGFLGEWGIFGQNVRFLPNWERSKNVLK